nr:hypothetical protein SHINE37_43902 [Rhizobiaceae bacterium]
MSDPAIDLQPRPSQSAGVRVFRVDWARRLRGKPVRCSERSAKTGAAPATVNGELLSLQATGGCHREGETDAMTRKPGDLP